MANKDHPKYPEWLVAQNNLIEVKEALKKGSATPDDVVKAQAAYNKIADEIDA